MVYKDRNCLECGLKYSPNNSKQKYCVSCGKKKSREFVKEYSKKYRQENKDKIKEYMKKYRQENKDELEEWGRKYYQKNKDKRKEYYQKNKDKKKKYRQENKEYIRKYRQENKDKIREQKRKYLKENKDKFREWRRKYLQESLKTDNNFVIKERLRILLCQALKHYTKTGKIRNSKQYGINYKLIIRHLKPFPEDLSKYHIDHIRPLCSFNFVNPDGSQNLEEIKIAFAPENHQWLLAFENQSKGGRYEMR